MEDINKEAMRQLEVAIPKCEECQYGSSPNGNETPGEPDGGSSSGGPGGGPGGEFGGTCSFPFSIGGTVEVTWMLGDQVYATGRAYDLLWRLDGSNSTQFQSMYVLERGRFDWEIDIAWGGDSCGDGHLSGSGSEDLVPNEQEVYGGEMGGPGLPGEFAFGSINWPSEWQPKSQYYFTGKVRLHGEWTLVDGCGDHIETGDANWPPVFRLNTWLQTSVDERWEFAQTMSGTYEEGYANTTRWTWDLTVTQ
jgi:hypothetical protein